MLALTLIDDNKDNPTPWASLMEAGIKTIETRKWPVPHRLIEHMPIDLLLCASASSRTENRSKAVCVVRLHGCSNFGPEHETAACCNVYTPGFAWHTDSVRWLSEKFYVKGQLGLFEVAIPEGVMIYKPTNEQIQQLRNKIARKYPLLP